jgi:hypothetical protein
MESWKGLEMLVITIERFLEELIKAEKTIVIEVLEKAISTNISVGLNICFNFQNIDFNLCLLSCSKIYAYYILRFNYLILTEIS